jgi:hypothetical protein
MLYTSENIPSDVICFNDFWRPLILFKIEGLLVIGQDENKINQ